MQSRGVVALEEGKDPSTTFKSSHARALPMRLVQFLVMFVVLGLGVSLLSMHSIRFFPVQHVAPTAPSTIRPCFEEPSSLESRIRPPSNLLHAMNDTELMWLASHAPQIKEYPFKRVPKIAFMFLTKGPLPMEPLWERFFRGHEGLYSIYLHSLPSYNADFSPTSVFYKRQIPSQVAEWGEMNSTLFGWGLNVGIMYMMSAGKAEINKLNTAMDETARIVQELKSELHKRKSPHNLQVSGSAGEANTTSCTLTQPELNKSSTENRGPSHMKMSSFTVSEDGECASSVLTEEQEPHPEVMDMDQLEAELESELQKLPWCAMDTPCHDGLSNLGQDIVSEVTAQGFHDLEGQGLDTEQFHGVLPSQLDQKLCHVLIEQQESQIVELESELHSAQSKLQQKETELETLKDCVKRLTELSLGNISDDENETCIGQEQSIEWNCNMEGCESTKPMVGMKRPIGSESCSYNA